MLRSVAIVGQMASGKTTLAERLIKDYGYTRVSFAERMRFIASQVYGAGGSINKVADYEVTRATGEIERISGRQLLQELGQSVKSLDLDIWVKWLRRDIYAGEYGDGPYVIDDCRFPFEADFLRDQMKFVIVKLDTDKATRMQRYERAYGRPPTFQELKHLSETEIEKIVPDVTIPGEYQPVELARLVVGSI
jgi:dephospho-CoA kinase